MHAAAAFSRPPKPDAGSIADTLQQIALLDRREADAIHVWSKMVLLRLRAREQQLIRLAAKG